MRPTSLDVKSNDAQAGSKGQRLLAEINIIRAVIGEDPIGQISSEPDGCGCPLCSLRASIPCLVDRGDAEIFEKRWRLQFADSDVAVRVGEALGQPVDCAHAAVLATDAIKSVFIAEVFGLVFWRWGIVAGWVEPTDEDHSVWDVHLLPGERYPPGHAPRGYDPLPVLDDAHHEVRNA